MYEDEDISDLARSGPNKRPALLFCRTGHYINGIVLFAELSAKSLILCICIRTLDSEVELDLRLCT